MKLFEVTYIASLEIEGRRESYFNIFLSINEETAKERAKTYKHFPDDRYSIIWKITELPLPELDTGFILKNKETKCSSDYKNIMTKADDLYKQSLTILPKNIEVNSHLFYKFIDDRKNDKEVNEYLTLIYNHRILINKANLLAEGHCDLSTI